MEQCLKSDLFLYVACGLISSNPESGLKLFDDMVKEGKVQIITTCLIRRSPRLLSFAAPSPPSWSRRAAPRCSAPSAPSTSPLCSLPVFVTNMPAHASSIIYNQLRSLRLFHRRLRLTLSPHAHLGELSQPLVILAVLQSLPTPHPIPARLHAAEVPRRVLHVVHLQAGQLHRHVRESFQIGDRLQQLLQRLAALIGDGQPAMAQHLIGAVPLRRVLLQHRADEPHERRGRLDRAGSVVGRERRRLALHRADQDLHRLELRQGRVPFEQLQRRDAQRPDVRLEVSREGEKGTREL